MLNVVTRFDNGFTNNREDHILADFPLPDWTKLHSQFDDFDRYTAADWVVTAVGAGAVTGPDGDGGVILLTNAAADDDSLFLQWAGGSGAVKETYLMAAGKKAWFKARFQVSDATQSDFVMGLQIADTTPLDATDGIFFIKDDGDAQLDIVVRKDATTGSNRVNNIATVVAATYMSVEWFYDGVDKVYYAVNGVVLGSLSATSAFLPDAALAISFGIQNGEAVAKTMTVDQVFVAKER